TRSICTSAPVVERATPSWTPVCPSSSSPPVDVRAARSARSPSCGSSTTGSTPSSAPRAEHPSTPPGCTTYAPHPRRSLVRTRPNPSPLEHARSKVTNAPDGGSGQWPPTRPTPTTRRRPIATSRSLSSPAPPECFFGSVGSHAGAASFGGTSTQGLHQPVDVLHGVVEVEGGTHTPVTGCGGDPGRGDPFGGPRGNFQGHDRRTLGFQIERGTQPVGQSHVVCVYRLHPDLLHQGQGVLQAHPGRPDRGKVETGRIICLPDRDAVKAVFRVRCRVPVRGQGGQGGQGFLGPGEKCRSPSAQQPLVGAADRVVVVPRRQRYPPGGLSGVHHRTGTVIDAGRAQILQRGQGAVGRLYGGHGNQAGGRADLFGQVLQRYFTHSQITTG